MKRITISLLLIAATCCTGCHSVNSKGFLPWHEKSEKKPSKRHPLRVAEEAAAKKKDESDPAWNFGSKEEKKLDEPVKMFITWTESEYTQAGQPPIRGFTARAYFYNKQYEPIAVDGQLIVYGFDDTTREDAKRTADKKFVFPAEHLASQYSDSHLGASYSLWVPWDEVGGEQKQISLLPVFRTSKGQIVRGEQIVNLLHGTKPAEGEQENGVAGKSGESASGLRQVAYNAPLAAVPAARAEVINARQSKTTDMKTTTIQVPQSTLRHLQAPLVAQPVLSPRQTPKTTHETGTAIQPHREKSAHYIFDSSRTAIQPRDVRRYAQQPEHPIANRQPPIVNSPAAAHAGQQPIRSEPRIPQAPARRHAPPTIGHAQRQPYHAAPPYGQPPIQQSYPQLPLGGYSSAAQPSGY